MSVLEKFQLDNEFSFSKVNCGGNIILVRYDGTLLRKKSVEDFTLFFKVNNLLVVMRYKWNARYFLSFNKVFNKDQ